MKTTKIAMYMFANVIGMAMTLFQSEIPFIIACLVWAYGLAGLMTHITLYTNTER